MPELSRVLAATSLLALFAMAAATAQDHQDLLPPWPADATGLEGQLDVDITTAPAVVPGTEDIVGTEGLQMNSQDTTTATGGDGAEPDPSWLPELNADANMSECARDLLRSRLATTVAEDDILAAMALEAELLTLCRERQELVFTLYQVEAALTELRHAGEEDAGEGEDVAARCSRSSINSWSLRPRRSRTPKRQRSRGLKSLQPRRRPKKRHNPSWHGFPFSASRAP